VEFVIWIYKPLEEAQIKQLMNSKLDLAVQIGKNAKSPAPKEPLSGKKAELVLSGSNLQYVKPAMEYKKARRSNFLREPIVPDGGFVNSGGMPLLRHENDFEEIGISTLSIKGRLYYANHDSYDTLKLFQWGTEEADGTGKGFRTVVFASLQDKKGENGSHINFRKIVLPKAFVKRYQEFYDDRDGMGRFEAVFQQSTAQLRDWSQDLGEV